MNEGSMVENVIDVLLVEDNPDDAHIITEMLSETDLTVYRLHWRESMSAAKQWLDSNKADIVLLDLILPDTRGLDSLLAMRNHVPDIPIVVLTGIGHEEIGRTAIQEGAQDYICKNEINPTVMENSLRFAIERHRLMKQLEARRNRVAQNEHRFHKIIEKNADGIAIVDRDGNLKFLNPAAFKIFEKHENSSEVLKRIVEYMQRHKRSLRASKEPFELCINLRRNASVTVEIQVAEIDWEGAPAYLALMRNITERKELENSLRNEKELLATTMRSIIDGVITTDAEGEILSINPAAEKITGRSIKTSPPMTITWLLELTSPEDNTPLTDFSYGTTTITVDGNRCVLEYSSAPIPEKGGAIVGYVFVIRDITLRKKMAEEILKVQKLESLGVVAGRLAHEFDNVLTVILCNITIIKEHLSANRKALNILEKAEKSSLKARELTNQLYTFSKKRDADHKNGSISRLLHEIVDELVENSDLRFDCRWETQNDLQSVEFDKDLMYSALWNIVKNALEAMPRGGPLDISLSNQTITENNVLNIDAGDYLQIVIADHGDGMDNSTLQKIFDPFFSEKDKCSGMGLSTAFSIVRKHRGTIVAESGIGMGTTLTVLLPAAPPGGNPDNDNHVGGTA